MIRFFLRIIINILGITLANYALPNVTFTGSVSELILTGLFLTLGNAIIKPILKAVSLPLIIVTLGLFSLFINGLIIALVDFLIPELNISGFGALAGTTIILTILNLLI